MSTTNHRSGRHKELARRRIGPKTLVAPDNEGLLLEKETLISIANRISKITGEKLQRGQIGELIDFISQLPPEQFYQKQLHEAEQKIANLYHRRHANIRNSRARDGSDDVAHLSRVDEITPNGSIHEYLHEEVMNTTPNENQYKYSAHVDRRGNAVVDRDRVSGIRSSPNSVPSGYSDKLTPLSNFFSPENIDEIFQRANSAVPGFQTFQNITFPHRTIPLDSRNRVLAHSTSNQIKFNLNTAGHQGRLGDVRIQDTLSDIIEVRICPFWLPVNNPMDDYYSNIRMHINEFTQHAEVTEFLDSYESIPTVYGYHFEFEISRQEKNRIYLTPVCASYKFHKPIARVETLTLNFRSPFRPVTIEADRGEYTITYSPAASDPTTLALTDGSEHGLSTGDLIYILESGSGSSALNRELTREEGHVITRINNIEFTIETDTNAVAPGTETNITVLYGSKRIILQMEFTSLERS